MNYSFKWWTYDQTLSAAVRRTRMRKTNSTVSQTLPSTVEWLCTLSSRRPSTSHSPISAASCPAFWVRKLKCKKIHYDPQSNTINSEGILALFLVFWLTKRERFAVVQGDTEIIVRCKVWTDRHSNKAKLFCLVSLLTGATAADSKSPKHTYLLESKTFTLVNTNHCSELNQWWTNANWPAWEDKDAKFVV